MRRGQAYIRSFPFSCSASCSTTVLFTIRVPCRNGRPQGYIIRHAALSNKTSFLSAAPPDNLLHTCIPTPSACCSTIAMRLLAVPASLAALLGLAAAASIPGLPTCAGNCVPSDFGGCNQIDVKCICANSDLISNLACCVSTACSQADQESAYSTCPSTPTNCPTISQSLPIN